jgi:hypothetical protein
MTGLGEQLQNTAATGRAICIGSTGGGHDECRVGGSAACAASGMHDALLSTRRRPLDRRDASGKPLLPTRWGPSVLGRLCPGQPRRSEALALRTASARRQARWRSARLPCIGLPEGSCWLPDARAAPGQRARNAALGGPCLHSAPCFPRLNPSPPSACSGWPMSFLRRQWGRASCACRARAGRLKAARRAPCQWRVSGLDAGGPAWPRCISRRRGGARAPLSRRPRAHGSCPWEFLGREWARRGKVLRSYSPDPVMPRGVDVRPPRRAGA